MEQYLKALQELADTLNLKVGEITSGVDKVQDILNEINRDIDLKNEANRLSQHTD